MMQKKIISVGLGLIGGSLAKAIRQYTQHQVWGVDQNQKVIADARFLNVIQDEAGADDFADADMLLIALYPEAAVDFILTHLPSLKAGCVIIDLCGIKAYIAQQVAAAAKAAGVIYLGGHPMAGREFSGFEYSTADLFQGASMIFVPNESVPENIGWLTDLFKQLGFAKVVQTTAQQHDAMIAFTSQLAHIVSSAYIKSPEAAKHDGYSAGSYKDLTRVARLNEDMWTELFLHNAEPLVREIDEIIMHLQEYRNAIAAHQADTLHALLRDGRERKERLG